MRDNISNNRMCLAFKGYLQKVFACDVRSLALFRMVIAGLVLIDLGIRAPTIRAMFTDDGYFTRDLADQFYRFVSGSDSFSYLSLHKLSGAFEFQVALFVLTAIAAVCMLVGFKTRLATIVVWVLVASMQVRNPLINTSGDMLMKMLLFWSMFLPLGAVWSFDARNRAVTVAKRVASFATAGIILQLCFMYWFTGLSKCNEIWFRGEALDYVLHLDIYSRDFASVLLQFPFMMKLATWGTVYGEIVLPFLIFLPVYQVPMRYLNIAAFWGMHLVIALAMAIGLFSYISMAGWLPMLPGSFWNWPLIRNFANLMDRLYGNYPTENAGANKGNWASKREWVAWRRGGRKLAQIACFFLIIFCLLWNLGNIDTRIMPRQLAYVGAGLNLDQHFRMFDVPPQYSPWVVYDADLNNGERIDIFRRKPVSLERPTSVRLTIPNHHWRKLHRNLARPELAQFRKPLALYIAKAWNETHPEDKQIEYMKLICYMDELGPNASEVDQVIQVWGEVGDSTKRTLKLFEQNEDGMPF